MRTVLKLIVFWFLLASIGGYLGLLIGASAVSVLELLEQVMLSLVRCFHPRRH